MTVNIEVHILLAMNQLLQIVPFPKLKSTYEK